MLTPRFTASQTPENVTLIIYVPSVRASEIQISTPTSTTFNLHINPYFLRLTFPHPVLDVDSVDPTNTSWANYDPSSGTLTVVLCKATHGSDFGDLSMISRLLAVDDNSNKKDHTPTIEVLDSKEDEETNGSSDATKETSKDIMEPLRTDSGNIDLERERAVLLNAEKNNWLLPQNPDTTPGQSSFDSTFTTTTSPYRSYGFLDLHSGYFRHASSAFSDNEGNELGPDIEKLTPMERRARGKKKVDAKFDGSYYLADYVNDEDILEVIGWKHPYADRSDVEFTEEEKVAIINLPRKEYIPTPDQTRALYLTLVSLLFSSAYDTRTTQNDSTAESAWTITVLTPAFAALSPPLPTWTPAEVFVESYKRALSYPLYRHWGLCERCRADVVDILKGGRRVVLRVLLKMNELLKKHEAYYVYGKIWIEDFCVWLQKGADDESIELIAEEVKNALVQKNMLGWEIDELESAAHEVMEEPPDSDDESGSDGVEDERPSVL